MSVYKTLGFKVSLVLISWIGVWYQFKEETHFQVEELLIINRTISLIKHDDNCKNMLLEGYWQNFSIDYSISSPYNRWSGDFLPKNCKLFNYINNTAQECLKNEKVLLIGDSRTRILFDTIKAIYRGSLQLKDEKQHVNIEFGPLHFFWNDHLHKVPLYEDSIERYKFENATLVVVGDFTVHPLLGLLRKNDTRTFEAIQNHFGNMLESLEKESFPKFNAINGSVFVMSMEKLRLFANEDWKPFDDEKVEQFRSWWNDRLFSVVAKFDNLHFVRTNSLSAQGPNGEIIQSDLLHKGATKSISSLKSNLNGDIQRFLNFHCNRKFHKQEKYCCF